ncbi:hypothetical protein CWC05_10430 [Pseudoalteromonas ruthenica]|uniref:Uncharacterized protein n=1 Tax=Pseudoalteromonas ruthenica TaxID=151081 RepID=A0A5S3Z4X1_9GAMM|nr:hypothetical protein [Pseudoalteromonas ruthenica]TMP86885.1 hypothetical protein CWC05_10430 [Pseudoalteromonas ruthenica]
MKYIFEVVMQDNLLASPFDTVEEKFESAVSCAKTSIESILLDYPVLVGQDSSTITIIPLDGTSMPFTLPECAQLIKGAFLDANGHIYPEFTLVKKDEI